MVIICEGLDNTGKSTQILNIKSYLESKQNGSVHVLHYSNVKGLMKKEQIIDYSRLLYNDMFLLCTYANNGTINDIHFILDRSHLGETVYSPLYRQYEADWIWLMETYYIKQLKNRDKTMLFVFTDEIENVLKRDDGQSFSTQVQMKKQEKDLFEKAYVMSSIEHKHLISITNYDQNEVWHRLIKPLIEDRYNTLYSGETK